MSFKFEGTPKSAESVSKDSATLTGNDGLLISAPSNTQHIIIYDIIATASGTGKLGTSASGGGTQICLIRQGLNQFNAPVFVPAGQAVYTDLVSGNMTLTYEVVNENEVTRQRTNISSGGGGATTTAAPTTTTAAPTTTTAAPTTLSFAAGTS